MLKGRGMVADGIEGPTEIEEGSAIRGTQTRNPWSKRHQCQYISKSHCRHTLITPYRVSFGFFTRSSCKTFMIKYCDLNRRSSSVALKRTRVWQPYNSKTTERPHREGAVPRGTRYKDDQLHEKKILNCANLRDRSIQVHPFVFWAGEVFVNTALVPISAPYGGTNNADHPDTIKSQVRLRPR